MKLPNSPLAAIPTYRLTVFYLAAIFAGAVLLAANGAIAYRPLDLLFSLLVLLTTCIAGNWVFAKTFGASSSLESVCITAFILALIVTPFAPGDGDSMGTAVFAAAWAAASKYLLAPDRRHIFNPAALGVTIAALVLHHSASWWIGDCTLLLAPMIAGGALIAHRLRCVPVIAAFAAVALTVTAINGGAAATASVRLMALHSMFVFFAFVMLTEPRTTPMGLWRRIAFGALVGFLFSPSISFRGFYFTPEIALLIGNAVFFLTDSKRLSRMITRRRAFSGA